MKTFKFMISIQPVKGVLNRVLALLFLGTMVFSGSALADEAAMPHPPASVFSQDPQLQQLFGLVLSQNPQLAVAQAHERASFNQQRQAQSYEKAQVQFQSELSYAWMKKKDFARTANQLKASYPLYQPDKTDLTQVADFNHDAAQWQLEAQRQQMLMQVAQDYYLYWSQQAEYDFLIKEQASISSIMTQVRKRFQVGYQNLNDIAEIQARLDNNQADLVAAQQALNITESNLSALIGQSVDLSQLKRPNSLPNDSNFNHQLFKKTGLNGLPKSLPWQTWLAQNPLIKALNQQTLAASRQVDYEKNKNGLQLDVFGAYVYNDSHGNFYDDMQGAKGGLELKYPLYLGGRTDASVASARAQSIQVQALKRQKMLGLEATAKNALLSYQAGLDRLTALKAALLSNQEAVRATENGLRTGTRNILDLLNAQRNLHKAQRDVPITRAKIWQSWYQFYGALGLLQPQS